MTLLMGIVNVTPDSFSDGGRFFDHDAAVAHGLALCRAGAHILDIGGESTRPGAERVEPAVEQERILPVVRALAEAGAVVSVDTMNASTARAAVDAGARIVNDVSGGLADPEMLSVVAATGADIVLGHWRGHSADMYAAAEYADVAGEVVGELASRIDAAGAAGIPPARVIVDPGIGFGKRGEQNWAVLRATERITRLGPRVLVGTSRKRFLAETLDPSDPASVDEDRRDLATAVTTVLAAQAGAWGLRVHDISASRDALAVRRAWEGESRWAPTRSR
ncbi:dihydropteroate synthase [Microbacterium sp. Marseille-Q6648]|uniref:dihydropteroate synthase n=1 Tax=Microbacterium sp. Marseille-Q6648 TaxID=2937991 RepID=UPI00203E1BA5|nr:dihydropteroate synthase [Microbacterium sp. Marseille-Q6648]